MAWVWGKLTHPAQPLINSFASLRSLKSLVNTKLKLISKTPRLLTQQTSHQDLTCELNILKTREATGHVRAAIKKKESRAWGHRAGGGWLSGRNACHTNTRL